MAEREPCVFVGRGVAVFPILLLYAKFKRYARTRPLVNQAGAALLAGAVLVLEGCAHPRPKQASPIAIPAWSIKASDHPSFLKSINPQSARTSAIQYDERALPRPVQCKSPALSSDEPTFSGPAPYLVLSGGSQNGAFGAGFFLGLQEAGRLPAEPLVVTGVSTGALQSTFLFLARQPLPSDRDYKWARGLAMTSPGNPSVDLPAIAAGRSNIEDLNVAYSITREKDILRPVAGGGIGMLVNGTKATFDPLRKRLLGLISAGTIRAVAQQACRGRRLLVGVADVDDGQAYALDMTALALMAYDGDASSERMDFVRRAYVEGLLASSSVPVGAKPVTLRIRDMEKDVHKRHLFVDGGARFGVFLEDVQSFRANAAHQDEGHDGVTLIVNTRLSIQPWHADEDPHYPKRGWMLTTLGLRTVDILENQVYRLSVEAVEHKAAELAGLHMAYISNENLPDTPEPDAHVYRGQSCKRWHDADESAGHPLEFYAGYMACLMDYGRTRGRYYQWNRIK